MDIYQASKFLKENFDLDIKPEPLRISLRKYGLLNYRPDNFHVKIHSKDLEKYGEILSSDMTRTRIAELNNLSYSNVDYACRVLRINFKLKYGRSLFKTQEDADSVIKFCKNRKRKNKK
jgi:hypothetical protein